MCSSHVGYMAFADGKVWNITSSNVSSVQWRRCPVSSGGAEERAPLRHVTADLRRENARRYRSQVITVQ